MSATVEYVGLLASAGSLTLWCPQAVRLWRHRNDATALGGISITTQVVLLVTESLWATYAVLTGSLWVGVPAMVNIPLAVLAIRLLRRSRQDALAGESAESPADHVLDRPLQPLTWTNRTP
ncbi:hypothetical protein HP550_21235 [Cellulomonas humilata]|uniref:PQ-loop repeat-containing protein n=1 Tax=Cellulomonas humilata TaxID=144055 RepID=A0A7Y6A514_9CELL|nr:hypothetical protein [Cellulomonas humilata]NUU19775.1 hypothetical protein [Cellulomonas humilata]